MQFFEEFPGAERREPIDWATAKAELMKRPGHWGLMAENVSSSTPSQLRRGLNQTFRGPELEDFEFRIRRPAGAKASGYAKGRTDLYGRYVPSEARKEPGE